MTKAGKERRKQCNRNESKWIRHWSIAQIVVNSGIWWRTARVGGSCYSDGSMKKATKAAISPELASVYLYQQYQDRSKLGDREGPKRWKEELRVASIGPWGSLMR
jgi:hypothetical protein